MTRSFAAVLLTLVLAACGSLSIVWFTAGQSPTPDAADPCPLAQHACDFAADLNRWLLTDDLDPLLPHVSPKGITCEAHPRSTTPWVCHGVRPGEVREGYPMAFQFLVGDAFPASHYAGILRQQVIQARVTLSDSFGSGDFHLFGFECTEGASEADCSREYIVVFGGIYCDVLFNARQDVRQSRVLLLFAVQQDSEAAPPRITITGTYNDRAISSSDEPFNLDDLLPWTAPQVGGASKRGLTRPCPDPSLLPDLTPSLITPSDLPQGWSELSDIPFIHLGPDEKPIDELRHVADDVWPCGDVPDDGAQIAPIMPPVKSRGTFYSTGPNGPTLSQSVAFYEATWANRLLTKLRINVIQALPCAWHDFDAEGQPVDLTATPIPVPLIGDEAIAYRINAGFRQGDVQHGAAIVITVRVGNAVVMLQQAAVGDRVMSLDMPLLIRLAALSATRLMRLTP